MADYGRGVEWQKKENPVTEQTRHRVTPRMTLNISDTTYQGGSGVVLNYIEKNDRIWRNSAKVTSIKYSIWLLYSITVQILYFIFVFLALEWNIGNGRPQCVLWEDFSHFYSWNVGQVIVHLLIKLFKKSAGLETVQWELSNDIEAVRVKWKQTVVMPWI